MVHLSVNGPRVDSLSVVILTQRTGTEVTLFFVWSSILCEEKESGGHKFCGHSTLISSHFAATPLLILLRPSICWKEEIFCDLFHIYMAPQSTDLVGGWITELHWGCVKRPHQVLVWFRSWDLLCVWFEGFGSQPQPCVLPILESFICGWESGSRENFFASCCCHI